jgi:hypothetical protein
MANLLTLLDFTLYITYFDLLSVPVVSMSLARAISGEAFYIVEVSSISL